MFILSHLKTFIAVTQQGSFTRGAYELNLTQPAVSSHIAALEKELGVALFTRTGKRIVLTDAGRVVLVAARDILGRIEGLRGELADLKELKGGTITIGASKIIGVYILPKLLMMFREKFPDIELQVSIHSSHTIAEQVEDNILDLAIVAEGDQVNSRNIGIKAIGKDKLVVIAPTNHRLAASRFLTIDDACREHFILSGKSTASSKNIHRQLENLGIRLKSTIEMDEAGAIKRAVEEGAGLAIVSRAVVERELAENRLIELQLENWQPTRNIFMMWRHDRRFSKNTEALMRFLQRALTK